MSQKNSIRKNPSRETCENTIRRILMTEVLEHGKNKHFRSASDFMKYFESLYPASDALTKQVQRAVKAMDMPKDDSGYFIVNKTTSQHEQDNEIRELFSKGQVSMTSLEECDTVFLAVKDHLRSHLIYCLEHSETFAGKYVTILETCNGLILYTQNKNQLMILLNSLTI